MDFSKALARYLRASNLIELNLGATLAALLAPGEPKSAYPKISKMQMEQKLREFKKRVSNLPQTDESTRKQIVLWLDGAEAARTERNLYVHGFWDLLPAREAAPISVHVHPWMLDRLGYDSETKMSISDLSDAASRLEKLLSDFLQIKRSLPI